MGVREAGPLIAFEVSMSRQSPCFEDTVGVITGGGRGFGAALAHALAAEGMRLVLAGRNRATLGETATRLQPPALAIPTDVTDEGAVANFVERAETDVGPIELLVNNAGITEFGDIWSTSVESWWRVIEVNLKGPYLFSREVLKRMVRRARGRIVNISSYAGNVGSAEQSAYAVSKAALDRLTDSLSAQSAPFGVKVFAISPGLLKTDMGLAVQSHRGDSDNANWVPAERAAQLIVRIGCGELDRLSGRVIHVQDDVDEMLARVDEIESMDLYQLRLQTLSRSNRS